MSRYLRSSKAINDHEQYDKMFEDRGIDRIEHYRTPEYVPAEQSALDEVESQIHIWSMGDSYWKLSTIYYGDPSHWWILATFNKKPTESHNFIGDKLKIPVDLSEAMQVLK